MNLARVLMLMLATAVLDRSAAAGVVTFEGLSDGTILSNQCPGLFFNNATVLSSGAVGGSLNEFEFPPLSATNVAFDDGGPITIVFADPAQSFAGFFTYLTQLTLVGFDSANNPVGSAVSLFNSNLGLSGDIGSAPNEYISLAFAGGIKSVTIAADPVGASFTIDDAAFTSAGVPEPATLGVCGMVIAAFLARHVTDKRS